MRRFCKARQFTTSYLAGSGPIVNSFHLVQIASFTYVKYQTSQRPSQLSTHNSQYNMISATSSTSLLHTRVHWHQSGSTIGILIEVFLFYYFNDHLGIIFLIKSSLSKLIYRTKFKVRIHTTQIHSMSKLILAVTTLRSAGCSILTGCPKSIRKISTFVLKITNLINSPDRFILTKIHELIWAL